MVRSFRTWRKKLETNELIPETNRSLKHFCGILWSRCLYIWLGVFLNFKVLGMFTGHELNHWLGGGNSNIFWFISPKMGTWFPSWRSIIFQRGWNHQLGVVAECLFFVFVFSKFFDFKPWDLVRKISYLSIFLKWFGSTITFPCSGSYSKQPLKDVGGFVNGPLKTFQELWTFQDALVGLFTQDIPDASCTVQNDGQGKFFFQFRSIPNFGADRFWSWFWRRGPIFEIFILGSGSPKTNLLGNHPWKIDMGSPGFPQKAVTQFFIFRGGKSSEKKPIRNHPDPKFCR